VKVTRSEGTVTVVMTEDEAQNLEDHLLWDDYATPDTAAGRLWEGLGESSGPSLDSSQASA
jgi:hypothetical protein